MDLRTLIIAHLILLFFYAFCLVLVQLSVPRLLGLRRLTWAIFTGGAAAILIVLRGRIPDFLSIVVANTATLTALALVHCSIVEFLKRDWKLHFRRLALLIAVSIAGLSYYACVKPDLGARLLLMSAAMAIFGWVSCITLIGFAKPGLRIPINTVAAVLGLFALLNLVRFLTVWHQGAPKNLFESTNLQSFEFLTFMVFTAGMCFGFVWMTTAHLRVELEQAARTDSLTGLLNRRALLEVMQREISGSRRHGSPLSVLVIDLDHFKLLNDRYGHVAGDSALRAIATSLATHLRAKDTLARFGGEEFVAILPNTDGGGAFEVAERLRTQVAASLVEIGGRLVALTASFGVSSLQEADESSDSLLQRGDQALYAAKQWGRNLTVGEWEIQSIQAPTCGST
jgi:diguanylate cyclase (GGDEF)-like protein